jgi:hypothetical protein
MNVIVACGASKQTLPCPAGEMYTGGYHRACLEYALTLAPRENVFILSARYGLLALDTVIEPYDQRMKRNNPKFWARVWIQLDEAGAHASELVLLCGADYREPLRSLWQVKGWPVSAPLEGIGGIGKQKAWLKAQRQNSGAFSLSLRYHPLVGTPSATQDAERVSYNLSMPPTSCYAGCAPLQKSITDCAAVAFAGPSEHSRPV